jgi:hypothetical protein
MLPECKDGAAGLLAVYFINRPFTVTYNGALISDIQQNGGAADLFKFELDNVGCIFEEIIESEPDNGTFFNNQQLTLALQTLQDQDFAEIEALAKSRPGVIVQYRNGKARFAGVSRGLDTSGSNTSGGDFGDFQGYNLTMVARETQYAPLLDGYTLQDPFAGLTTPPNINDGSTP